MEFENNNTAANDVSDEKRQLAKTRKLTLNPVHDNIAPEPLPDGEEVARYVNGPAIANMPNDTEQTATPVQPSPGLLQQQTPDSKDTRRGTTTTIVVLCLLAAGIAAAIVYLFVR